MIMSSSEQTVAEFQVETSFDLLRWQVIVKKYIFKIIFSAVMCCRKSIMLFNIRVDLLKQKSSTQLQKKIHI